MKKRDLSKDSKSQYQWNIDELSERVELIEKKIIAEAKTRTEEITRFDKVFDKFLEIQEEHFEFSARLSEQYDVLKTCSLATDLHMEAFLPL